VTEARSPLPPPCGQCDARGGPGVRTHGVAGHRANTGPALPPMPSGRPPVDRRCPLTATNGQLVTQVRQALDAARKAGQPVPGRPTLVRLTGATDHAVRKTMAKLVAETASPGEALSPADRSTASASPTTSACLVAWAGFVFGSVMSVAANVLHTWLPASEEPPGWSPPVAAQIGAAVWPVGGAPEGIRTPNLPLARRSARFPIAHQSLAAQGKSIRVHCGHLPLFRRVLCG
jgi:hypothetical protein